MPLSDIAQQRLRNQGLLGRPLARPEQVVAALGAVQAQDYAGAKWGIGQRTARATDAELDRLFDSGAILRTHLMRPTWHLVSPADIRWLLALTAPRVRAVSVHLDRKLEVDEAVRIRSARLLERALRDGQHLTRSEVATVLSSGGIPFRGQRLAHLLMHAELDALLCSGPRRGKQFTYALLEERVPPSTPLHREEALAALAGRYFTGHGPATVGDCAWWSGLSVADVQAGIAAARRQLEHEEIDGKTYWFASWRRDGRSSSPVAHLLPNYDEYLIAYRDRAAFFDPLLMPRPDPKLIFANVVAMDGRVAGLWRRQLHKGELVVETTLGTPLKGTSKVALRQAVERYARFTGLSVKVVSRHWPS